MARLSQLQLEALERAHRHPVEKLQIQEIQGAKTGTGHAQSCGGSPTTPHLTAKGLGPCPRYIRTPECRGNVSPTPGDSSVPLSQGSFIPLLPNYGHKVRTCTNLLINIQHSAAYPGLSETSEVPLLLIFHIRSPN